MLSGVWRERISLEKMRKVSRRKSTSGRSAVVWELPTEKDRKHKQGKIRTAGKGGRGKEAPIRKPIISHRSGPLREKQPSRV